MIFFTFGLLMVYSSADLFYSKGNFFLKNPEYVTGMILN